MHHRCEHVFFTNPYVKDLLCHLEPRHCPVYRKKLTRIVWCIMDVSQSEVCTIYFFAKCYMCVLTLSVNSQSKFIAHINNFILELFILYRSSYLYFI